MTNELAIREAQEVEPMFDITPDEARRSLQAIRQFQAVVHAELIEGHDYGTIPGTEKPTLYKPGAEKLAKLLKCADKYEIEESKEEWETGFFYYRVKCRLVLIGTDTVISEGIGSANSMEAKWRYRWVFESEIPEGMDKNQLKRRQGKSKRTGKPYVQYRIENPDIYDLVNTIQKMGKKRALVDATLSAGRLSNLFTQDIEEVNGYGEVDESDEQPEPTEEEKQKALDRILKKIAGFKSNAELFAWAGEQDIANSILKDEISKALEARIIELAPEEEPTEKENPPPEPEGQEASTEGSEPSEPEPDQPKPPEGPEPEISEEDELFAQIIEVLEAAGYDQTYIDNRMHGLQQLKADDLRTVLENEKKRLKNGNGKQS